MHRAHRYIASVLLVGALIAPVSIMAGQPQDHDPNRVYDRNHKDYHNWDDHENQAWHHYLEENPKKNTNSPRRIAENRMNTGIGATAIQTEVVALLLRNPAAVGSITLDRCRPACRTYPNFV
jgi:hypothetical protein